MKRIVLFVLGIIALAVIITSLIGNIRIMGYVVKNTNKCVAAMEQFENLKEDYECETEDKIERCTKDGLIIYYKTYKDGSKEWNLGSETYFYDNVKKMCR